MVGRDNLYMTPGLQKSMQRSPINNKNTAKVDATDLTDTCAIRRICWRKFIWAWVWLKWLSWRRRTPWSSVRVLRHALTAMVSPWMRRRPEFAETAESRSGPLGPPGKVRRSRAC